MHLPPLEKVCSSAGLNRFQPGGEIVTCSALPSPGFGGGRVGLPPPPSNKTQQTAPPPPPPSPTRALQQRKPSSRHRWASSSSATPRALVGGGGCCEPKTSPEGSRRRGRHSCAKKTRMASSSSGAPPTLCELKYDDVWDYHHLGIDNQPHVYTTRVVSSAKSHPGGRSGYHHHYHHQNPHSSFSSPHLAPSLADSSGAPPNAVLAFNGSSNSYYDYLKNYYWEQLSTVHNGGRPSSPTLPVRSQTSLTWCAGYDGEGPMGPGRGYGGDRALLSLPSLSRTGHHGEELHGGGEERKSNRLVWIDALNAWISDKKPPHRNPFISFINSPPRVERHMYAKESSQRRGQPEQRRLHRKSYSSPLYDPETLRKSRTVRFEAPRTVSTSPSPPQPMMIPEQIELPQAVWEDEMSLEGESFELAQAREDLQENVVVDPEDSEPEVEQVHVLDPPVIVNEPLHWVEEREPTPMPEPEVVQEIPVEERRGITNVSVKRIHGCNTTADIVVADTPTQGLRLDVQDNPPPPPPEPEESRPLATSSPRVPAKPPSPVPPPATIEVEEPEISSSESMTPPPTPPPVEARRPTIVDHEEAEAEAEKTNLVGLMSRLSSFQRARPKPKPKRGKTKKKKERPPEKPLRLAKPKPTERPPPPPPQKPIKSPKPPPAPKPVKQPPKPPKPKPEPKEKKIIPKPAPRPPPPVKEKKPKPKCIIEKEEPVDKPIPLPISAPEEIASPEPEEPPPPPSPKPAPPPQRAPVKKKEKLPPPPPRRRTPTPPPKPPTPVFDHKETGDWIYGSDEEEKKEDVKDKEAEAVTIDMPSLPSALPTASQRSSAKSVASRGGRSTIGMPLMALKSKPRWGQKQKDTSMIDDEERERLAELRRRKFAALIDKNKSKRGGDKDQGDQAWSDFDDSSVASDRDSPLMLDGFLGKYCIFNQAAREKYRHTFNILDETCKGYLTEEETALGLGFINPNLKDSEITYLFRVLEIVGHRVKDGTELNMFCLLAALSQRVSRLDEWAHCEWARKMMSEMGKLMSEADYKNMERKMFLSKTLWECNVDDATSTISRDQLLVELRAGGLSEQHETEVLSKMPRALDTLLPHSDGDGSGNDANADSSSPAVSVNNGEESSSELSADHLSTLPRSLDFFDFLLYVPLFIMIHESVVTDPLSMNRTL